MSRIITAINNIFTNRNTYYKRFYLLLFILVPAIIPYILRCFFCYYNYKEIPFFYQNEWDLYVFCIAVAIALIAENNEKKKAPYRTSICVSFIVISIACMIFSLFLEYLKMELERGVLYSIVQLTEAQIKVISDGYDNQKAIIYPIAKQLSRASAVYCCWVVIFKKIE